MRKKIFSLIACGIEKSCTFAAQNASGNLEQRKKVPAERSQAEIAQLVEHDLAKVGVASSSLVFRSKAKAESQEEFLEQREQRQTKFDYAESRTRMPIGEAKRK